MNPGPDNTIAAFGYAHRGWHVFPCHFMMDGACSCRKECHSPGKHPMTANGFKDATNDIKQVREWWERAPDASIGIRTGPESGLWVLDLDGSEGIEAFARIEAENSPLPSSPVVRTGGGGRHHYFAWPEGIEVKGRNKIGGVPIDVKGTRGYVIAPPSNHHSGGVYIWLDPIKDASLTDAPPWLLDYVTGRHERAYRTDDFSFDEMTNERLDLKTAPGVSEGSRHRRALELIGAHLGRGEDSLTVASIALKWADQCDPPMGQDEILRIVTDLSKKEAEKFDAGPKVREIDWPTLEELASYGLAGEIVRAIEPET